MAVAEARRERPGQALVDEFCDSLWLEDGLSKNTLDAYKRDLLLFADWLPAGELDSYMAGLILPSMVLVAAGTVLQALAQGKNPPDVSDPEFVNTVFWKTVSLGFYQDFIRGATDAENPLQAGSQLGGPNVQAMTDIGTLGAYALSDANAAATGGEDTTNTGRQAVRTLRNFVPRHWATDAAVERLVWDNMQRAVDPEADADFARRARRVEQGYWWEPGDTSPGEIDWSTLDLGDQDGDYAGR